MCFYTLLSPAILYMAGEIMKMVRSVVDQTETVVD